MKQTVRQKIGNKLFTINGNRGQGKSIGHLSMSDINYLLSLFSEMGKEIIGEDGHEVDCDELHCGDHCDGDCLIENRLRNQQRQKLKEIVEGK